MHFFDQYPQFYETGITPNANRLRCRYDAIIKANTDILQGSRVLDVASHNGRWSAAAILGGGAAHVVGVEPRAELVEVGNAVATEIGIAHQVDYRATTIMDYPSFPGSAWERTEFEAPPPLPTRQLLAKLRERSERSQ